MAMIPMGHVEGGNGIDLLWTNSSPSSAQSSNTSDPVTVTVDKTYKSFICEARSYKTSVNTGVLSPVAPFGATAYCRYFYLDSGMMRDFFRQVTCTQTNNTVSISWSSCQKCLLNTYGTGSYVTDNDYDIITRVYGIY